MADSKPETSAVILWAWPRTRSTVFERFFLARSTDDVEVLHEPLSAPIFWSKTRVSSLFSQESCDTKYKDFANATFESAWQDMTHSPAGKKAVFTKDMAKYVVEVATPLPNAMKAPDFEKDGNPSYIPTDKLLASNVKHVFLIRSPEQSVPSWARLGRREDIGIGHFLSSETGISQSVKLYKFLESKLPEPPLVIDTDDIFDNSEAIVRKLCDLINVEFQSCMLKWPDSPVISEMFAKWQGWHDDVAESNGVCSVRGKEHAWEVDDEVKAGIAEHMDDYLYLKARAHRFTDGQ